jgi:hypothetical protein
MREEKIEMVPLKNLRGVACGWAGCQESYVINAAAHQAPEGWRALVVTKYNLLEPAGVLNADHDKMLCPAHVAALQPLLKKGAR